MKKAFLTLMAIGLALGLVACAQATSPGTTTTDPNAPQNPTLSALVGTWTASNTSSDTSGGTTTTHALAYTMSVAADGSSSIITVQASTPAGGRTTTTYSGTKGQLSFTADQVKMTNTATCSSATPITAATATWTPESVATSSTSPAILSGGKFYLGLNNGFGYLVFAAQGSVSGLVGSWPFIISSTSSSTTNYWKIVEGFAADGTVTATQYSDTSGTFTAAPVSTTAGTYTINNGILTITPSGQSAQSWAYKIVGSYLILGNATSADAYAFTKQ